jgi:hypothetical protein
MTEKPSGREGGEENVRAFHDWGAERDRARDWTDYLHRGQLNRSEIARECTFALSCFRSNPGLKSALMALEARLRETGILPSIASDSTSGGIDNGSRTTAESRVLRAKYQAEQRVKVLEEQNAALRAEVTDLRDQLRRFEHLDAHLCKTGRLLHP